jgi:hypothetical protein
VTVRNWALQAGSLIDLLELAPQGEASFAAPACRRLLRLSPVSVLMTGAFGMGRFRVRSFHWGYDESAFLPSIQRKFHS